MNQILVTEKIYVTPELKRKKKIYKILFMLSVFSIISLFSAYIYAEYDRNKDESISEDILSFMTVQEDETTVSSYENALVVKITQDIVEEMEEIEQIEQIEQTEQIEGSQQGQNGNNEETKQQLQMATATSIYTAPNGKKYETIGVVRIPKINITYPILSKTTDALMKVAPCKFHGSSPNEVGNLCIIAHNYRRKGVFFSDVEKLAVGDIVEIQDLSQRTIQYEVYDIHTVIPGNVADTTQKTNGRKEVTLITCTDDSEQRIIVRCKEKK